MILKKDNIKISFKFSDVGQGLNLKLGELGTDGENVFLGKAGGNVALSLPIGSTLFWLPVKFSNQNNGAPINIMSEIYLPDGWMIADGSKVEDQKSPYYNLYLPNLTTDIFIMGTFGNNLGSLGGTHDSSHKHNIAHHHYSFNGANNIAGYVIANGDHTHGYYDYAISGAWAEEGGAHGASGNSYPTIVSDNYGNMDPSGAHVHTTVALLAGSNTSGLFIDNVNHVNQGNSRDMSDTQDFTENRPKYICGIYIIRVR